VLSFRCKFSAMHKLNALVKRSLDVNVCLGKSYVWFSILRRVYRSLVINKWSNLGIYILVFLLSMRINTFILLS
jgi:hypothetical protein